jgi:hypothetical protein
MSTDYQPRNRGFVDMSLGCDPRRARSAQGSLRWPDLFRRTPHLFGEFHTARHSKESRRCECFFGQTHLSARSIAFRLISMGSGAKARAKEGRETGVRRQAVRTPRIGNKCTNVQGRRDRETVPRGRHGSDDYSMR